MFSKFWKQNNDKNRILNVIIPCFITASLIYSFIYFINKNTNKIGNNNNKSSTATITTTTTTTSTKINNNNKIKFYEDSDRDDINTNSTFSNLNSAPSSSTIIKKKDDYIMAWYNPRYVRTLY